MDQKLCDHGTAATIFVLKPCVFNKKLESLFNTVMGQDVIISDDVGWRSGFNKGGNSIGGIDIGLYNTVDGMGTNN